MGLGRRKNGLGGREQSDEGDGRGWRLLSVERSPAFEFDRSSRRPGAFARSSTFASRFSSVSLSDSILTSFVGVPPAFVLYVVCVCLVGVEMPSGLNRRIFFFFKGF